MELAQDSWATYFRSVSSEPQKLLVAMESVGARAMVDERIDAMCEGVCTRHPLLGIAYEPSWDTLEVSVGLSDAGPLLRYFVAGPRRIFVKETSGARAILVNDSGGGRTLVCLFAAIQRGGRVTALVRPLDDDGARVHPLPETARRALRADGRRRGRRPAGRAGWSPRWA
jgi:hypothetical protein